MIKKEIKLKGVSIDEKGFCNFHTDMPEPHYYYRIIEYKNKKYLEINIKCYGDVEINDISIEPIEEKFEIMISGKSKSNIDEQQIESIKGTLKYSDFNVKINLPNKIEDKIFITDISNESKGLRKQNNTGKVSLYFEIEEQNNQEKKRKRIV